MIYLSRNHEYRFWTSRIALCIYGNVLVAFLFRQTWLLYGVAFILTAQIALVFSKWVKFVESDPQYDEFIQFIHQNVGLMLDEYEKITSGQYGAARLAVGRIAAQVSMNKIIEKMRWGRGSLKRIRHSFQARLLEHRPSLLEHPHLSRRSSVPLKSSSSWSSSSSSSSSSRMDGTA